MQTMLRTILVPLDGSTFAQHALPAARTIAKQTRATVVLTHVHAPHVDRLSGEDSLGGLRITDAAANDEQRRREMNHLTARCCELVAGDVKVGCNLLDGAVVPTLIEHARSQAADLVVMTTHGRGAFSRAWLGSVVDAFVRHCPVPTLLVRPRLAAETMAPRVDQPWDVRRVLLPLDGSALAEQILDPATALALALGAEVLLLRIAAPPTMAESSAGDTVAHAAVRAYLDGVAEKLRAHGLAVRVRVEGAQQAARAILYVARDEHCDLLALATHGRGGLARIVMGSVADKIVRAADTPVLLLRPG